VQGPPFTLRFVFRLLFNNPEEVKRIRFRTWSRIYWV